MRLVPPVIAALCLLASVLLHYLLPALRFPFPAHQLAGTGLASAGILLAISAIRRFFRHTTTVEPFGTPTALVTTGVYRVTRNPMYLGIALVLLGIAVFVASAYLLFAPAAFVAIVNARQIPLEESRLTALFGDDYAVYRRRTRRWL
jgi:protein-S-isoprenylcysteine O-methyltransferase Ste14